MSAPTEFDRVDFAANPDGTYTLDGSEVDMEADSDIAAAIRMYRPTAGSYDYNPVHHTFSPAADRGGAGVTGLVPGQTGRRTVRPDDNGPTNLSQDSDAHQENMAAAAELKG